MDMFSEVCEVPDNEQKLRLFVGGLPSEATEKDLFDHFKRFGELLDVHISRTPEGRSKLFGYVQFAAFGQAAQALNDSKPHFIKNKLVNVNIAIPREEVQVEQTLRAKRSLILKNIPLGITKQQVRSLVARCGPIDQLSKLRRSNPQSLFCYVTMQTVDSAHALLKREYLPFEFNRRIYIEKFIPKSLRSQVIKRSGETRWSVDRRTEGTEPNAQIGSDSNSDQGLVGEEYQSQKLQHHLMNISLQEIDTRQQIVQYQWKDTRQVVMGHHMSVFSTDPQAWANQSQKGFQIKLRPENPEEATSGVANNPAIDWEENYAFRLRFGSQAVRLNFARSLLSRLSDRLGRETLLPGRPKSSNYSMWALPQLLL